MTPGQPWNMRSVSCRRMWRWLRSSSAVRLRRPTSSSLYFTYVLDLQFSKKGDSADRLADFPLEQEQVEEGRVACRHDGIWPLSCRSHNGRCVDLLSLGSHVCTGPLSPSLFSQILTETPTTTGISKSTTDWPWKPPLSRSPGRATTSYDCFIHFALYKSPAF